MPRGPRQLFVVAVIALWCAAFAVFAPRCAAQHPPELQVGEWLRGPDRRDFPWDVRLLRPSLTYGQRYEVTVVAEVRVGDLPPAARSRELHFVVKAADEQGRWFDDEDYNHQTITPQLDRSNVIRFISSVYLRPGKYVIAVIAYESLERGFNVGRQPVRVFGPSHDPLPQLDHDLPPLEFLDLAPEDAQVRLAQATLPSPLPVHNTGPMRVDVVLNLSSRFAYERVFAMGAVLSRLGLDHGCVRVTGVDLTYPRILFDRVDSSEMFGGEATQKIVSLDDDKIDVGTLRERNSAPSFLRQLLSDMMYSSTACSAGKEPLRRLIVVVGHTYVFPKGTRVSGVWRPECRDCEFYYLQDYPWFSTDVSRPYLPGYPIDDLGPANPDQVRELLKPVRPRYFILANAEDFRKVLAQLISHLEKPRHAAAAH